MECRSSCHPRGCRAILAGPIMSTPGIGYHLSIHPYVVQQCDYPSWSSPHNRLHRIRRSFVGCSTALQSYVRTKKIKQAHGCGLTRLKPAPVALIFILLKLMKVVDRSKQNLPGLLHHVFPLNEFESPCIEFLKCCL